MFFWVFKNLFDIQNFLDMFFFFGFMQKHLWRIICIIIKIKTNLG